MGNNMVNMTQEKGPKEVTVVEPPMDALEATKDEANPAFEHVHPKTDKKARSKGTCCGFCCEAVFVILCIITLIKAVCEICVSVSGAISTRLFSAEQSGPMVGMVLLALLAAVTISILIYALIAVFRKQAKPLHAASLVLLITAILQAVVVGVAVRVTQHDKLVLEQSMKESFELAREENPRHVQMWAATQNDLACCGLNSPYDYRIQHLPDVFPPNVPIACCPTYDPSRSDLVQERDRETCKLRRTYYTEGCREAIFDVVKTTSDLVLGLTISLIISELILAILAGALYRRIKNRKVKEDGDRRP